MSGSKNKEKSMNAKAPRPGPEMVACEEVLTLAEAAAYLRLSEEKLVGLVRDQGLPGRRIGHEWRFLKAALQDWLRTPQPPAIAQEELMQWAGAFRDDPDLNEIVREAYRQRGRQMTEAKE
jgi:excisionase family DNA binding protein